MIGKATITERKRCCQMAYQSRISHREMGSQFELLVLYVNVECVAIQNVDKHI